MRTIERTTGLLSHCSDLEELLRLKSFPIRMLSPASIKSTEDAALDLVYDISKTTGLIQIRTLPAMEELYQDNHFNTTFNSVWREHDVQLARLIGKVTPTQVYEIGGGCGQLNSVYTKNVDSTVKWKSLDPAGIPCDGFTGEYIRGFFPNDFHFEGNCLVHANFIEHVYDPEGFFEIISKELKIGDYMVFSGPDNLSLLEKCSTTFMNFEHNWLYTEDYADYLLLKYGFEIIEKYHFGNGHSIFYVTRKARPEILKDFCVSPGLYEKYKAMFQKYVEVHRKQVYAVNQELESIGKQPVYLFGGHISTQFYRAFGLDLDRICGILDNNPDKHGMRVSGMDSVISPSGILKGLEKPVVILPNSPYVDEIKRGILEGVNADTVFIPFGQ